MTMAVVATPRNREVKVFEGGPDAAPRVADVRRFVARQLGDNHRCLDDACVCVSELVTNALRHTRSGGVQHRHRWFRVHVEWTASDVRLCVEDTGTRPPSEPTMLTASVEDEGHRGLAVVDALAKEWRVIPGTTRYGHIVDVHLTAPAEA